MLKRLVRYDLRDISKTAVPMLLASVTVSIFCCAVLYFTFGFAEQTGHVFDAIALTGGLYFLGIVSIVIMVGIVAVKVILRYYRSVFTDEAHLYMVVPVTKRQFLNAKVISSVIWMLICSAVLGACVVIALILPTLLYDTSLVSTFFDMIIQDISTGEQNTNYLIASAIVECFISFISTVKDVMIVIAAISIGCVYFKRFRLPASVGILFGITFLEEMFTVAIKSVVVSVASTHKWAMLVFNSIFEIVLTALVFAAAYLYTLFLLEKKLNIE